MEAIFLACGAGGPQLKRNPLGANPEKPMSVSASEPPPAVRVPLGLLIASTLSWIWGILCGLTGLENQDGDGASEGRTGSALGLSNNTAGTGADKSVPMRWRSVQEAGGVVEVKHGEWSSLTGCA